jgi:hypothetical protein
VLFDVEAVTMRLGFWLCSAVLGCLVVAGVEGAAPKRPAPPPPQNTNANQNAFRNNQYRSQLANLQRQMTNLQRQMANMQRQNAQNANSFTDYDIIPIDECPTRRLRLPTKDEDGKPKTYSEKEKKELKGDDPKLPGYTASWDNLKVGQTCQVTLSRKRTDSKDSDKVTYVTLNTITGTIQKIDPSSQKQLTLRVRGAANANGTVQGVPGQQGMQGVPGQNQQQRNNQQPRIVTVPADPDKPCTLIVIVSENTNNNNPLTANNN